METKNALASLQHLDMKYRHVPLDAVHSEGVADSLTNRLKTMKHSIPIAVRRFHDRSRGPIGYHGPENKLARDLFRKPNFESLTSAEQTHVKSTLDKIQTPSNSHPYLKKGFTFGQARHVLMEIYRLLSEASHYPQDIRTKISELADAMEKDLAEAAKQYGFYDEYSQLLKSVKNSILASRASSTGNVPSVPR